MTIFDFILLIGLFFLEILIKIKITFFPNKDMIPDDFFEDTENKTES